MSWIRSSTVRRPLCCLVLVLLLTGGAFAEDLEDRYFEALRERELFRVAASYAHRKLSDPDLGPASRVQFTIHLSRALCQHARLSLDSSSPELWLEADRVIQTLQESSPEMQGVAELRLQRAQVALEQAQSIQFTMEVTGEDASLRLQALNQIKLAQQHLLKLQDTLRATRDQNVDSAALGSIDVEIRRRLAECWLTSGLLLPSGPDRAGSWQEANLLLDDLIRTQKDAELRGRCRLLRAIVARHQQDTSTAETLLQVILGDSTGLSTSLRDQAVAELARLRLTQQRLDEALKLLSDRVRETPAASAEVRAMIVESLLVLWQTAGRQGKPDLQSGVLEQAEQQLAVTGGEWHRWAASRLDRIREERDYGPELADHLRAARSAYQAGNLAEAAVLFGAAAELAENRQLADKAVELFLTQGSLLLQASRFGEAADVLARIPSGFQGHSRAGEADLLKCYALGQQASAHPTQEAHEAYHRALQAHIQSFAGNESAGEAVWMLGVSREGQGNLIEAWKAYETVPAGHPRSDEALFRMALVLEQLFPQLVVEDSSRVDRALQDLQQRLEARTPGTQRLSLLQVDTALKLASLRLRASGQRIEMTSPSGSSQNWIDRVQLTLDAESRDAELADRQLDEAWTAVRHRLNQLRIITLASQRRLDEAGQLLVTLQQSDPLSSLQVLSGLAELSKNLPDADRPLLGRLQLQASENLLPLKDQLPADQKLLLNRILLESNLAVGRLGEALSHFAQAPLEQQDLTSLSRVSEAVLQEGDRNNLQKTRELWTKQEARLKKGTSDWFTCRWMLARLLQREGSLEECRKLLGVTRIVYPQLGGPEMAARFQAIQDSLPPPARK